MATKRKILTVGMLLALVVALAACGEATQTASPTPTPTKQSFNDGEWTIETPSGWTRKDATKNNDAKKAVEYNGPNGEYFIVAIDPMGSDFAYDALWRYAVKGSGFEIVERTECTSATDETCRDKDARYDGWILWKSGEEPQKVGGHTWYFTFGNTSSATVDAALFEEIVESVRVTA